MIGLCLWASVCWGQISLQVPPSVNVNETAVITIQYDPTYCPNTGTVAWQISGGTIVASTSTSIYVQWASTGLKFVQAEVSCGGGLTEVREGYTIVSESTPPPPPAPTNPCRVTFSADKRSVIICCDGRPEGFYGVTVYVQNTSPYGGADHNVLMSLISPLDVNRCIDYSLDHSYPPPTTIFRVCIDGFGCIYP